MVAAFTKACRLTSVARTHRAALKGACARRNRLEGRRIIRLALRGGIDLDAVSVKVERLNPRDVI